MNRQQIKLEANTALKGNRLMFLLAILIIGALTGTGIGVIIAPICAAGLFPTFTLVMLQNVYLPKLE